MLRLVAPLLLLLMRVLQGAAIGGEVPGAWVFVAEHVPRQRIGIACGTLTAGLTAGIWGRWWLLLNTALSHQAILDGGWRVPFFLGGFWPVRDICAVGCKKHLSLKRCRHVKL